MKQEKKYSRRDKIQYNKRMNDGNERIISNTVLADKGVVHVHIGT